MRKVKFIDLVVTDVMATDKHSYHGQFGLSEYVSVEEDLISTSEVTVDTFVVPVNRFCKSAEKDTFIAYSKDVEKLLGINITALVDSKVILENALNEKNALISKIRHLSVWERIVAVFKGIDYE